MLFIICLVVVCYVGFILIRIKRVFSAIKAKTAKTKPYFHLVQGTNHHILILGDSSMYSVGVQNPENTVGGLLSAKYPDSSIETVAVNGAKVKDLSKQLEQASYKRYDLIVVGIGSNDIVQFSGYSKLQRELAAFLKNGSKISDQLVLCHGVNVGNIGVFPFPFNYLFDYRSRLLSNLFSKISLKFPKVINVIFYRPLGDDHYDKHSRKKFVAGDGYHATDYANKYFFKLIWKELQKSSEKTNKNLRSR